MKDLNKIAKSIDFIAKPAKNGGKNYFCQLELINGSKTTMFCESEVVDAMKVLKETQGKSTKSKELVEEVSEKTGKPYIAVKVVLADDTDYRFFPKRAFQTIIKAVYANLLKDKK